MLVTVEGRELRGTLFRRSVTHRFAAGRGFKRPPGAVSNDAGSTRFAHSARLRRTHHTAVESRIRPADAGVLRRTARPGYVDRVMLSADGATRSLLGTRLPVVVVVVVCVAWAVAP
ncbi:MAG TPA: hypothetical protein VFD92_14735 [Candidatus Binatia bacterium]|nr:hypothetical protein [Candidatus Binatia bacterium]